MDTKNPRILFVDSGYFLSAEIRRACEQLGYPLRRVVLEDATKPAEFLQSMLSQIQSFRPDFVLVLNHTGVDSSGVLISILEKMNIPLASWFVDSPELTLSGREQLAGDGVCLFCWDKGALPYLDAAGCRHTRYLPLATDPSSFRPQKSTGAIYDVLFVGNSWLSNVSALWKYIRIGDGLSSIWERAAQEISHNKVPDVRAAIEHCCRDRCAAGVVPEYDGLSDDERRIFNRLVIFEASRLWRAECVAALRGCGTVVGDGGWKSILGEDGFCFEESVPYEQLFALYGAATVNFNCTSLQMHTAVNQRVFDVPVCGGFLLTDDRPELHDLFAEDELAVFGDVTEIDGAVSYWRKADEERAKRVKKARKRILNEHTYVHRMQEIVRVIGELF